MALYHVELGASNRDYEGEVYEVYAPDSAFAASTRWKKSTPTWIGNKMKHPGLTYLREKPTDFSPGLWCMHRNAFDTSRSANDYLRHPPTSIAEMVAACTEHNWWALRVHPVVFLSPNYLMEIKEFCAAGRPDTNLTPFVTPKSCIFFYLPA